MHATMHDAKQCTDGQQRFATANHLAYPGVELEGVDDVGVGQIYA